MRRIVAICALLGACANGPGETSDQVGGALDPAQAAHFRVLVEPEDNGAALVAAIQGARASVHMTMYMLTDGGVIDALLAQHKAGVDVKVILNHIVHSPGGPIIPNRKTYDGLRAAGVPVVWAPSDFSLTHEKAVVIDRTAAWIMTMNATPTSMSQNREFLVVDSSPADVAEAEAQFEADFAGKAFTPSGALVVAPDNARARILALVDATKATLDVEAEELSDDEVTAHLCAAAGHHVATRVVLSNRGGSDAQQKATDALKACGVTVVALAHPYVHAKAIVADRARAYVGSANLSRDSLDRNRELGVIAAARAAVAVVADTVAKDIAAGTAL